MLNTAMLIRGHCLQGLVVLVCEFFGAAHSGVLSETRGADGEFVYERAEELVDPGRVGSEHLDDDDDHTGGVTSSEGQADQEMVWSPGQCAAIHFHCVYF
jgi:hypothetical protein